MSCHDWNGVADISPYATLTGARAINDPSGTNVAQIVISGSASVSVKGSPNMPAFGDAYSNQEIADVTNYVTARFGTKRLLAQRNGRGELAPSIGPVDMMV